MPTLWAHGVYFNVSSTVVAPTLSASEAGYPLWQASGIALGSLGGGLHPYWERFAWWLSFLRRVWRLPRSLRGALDAFVDELLWPVGQVVRADGVRTRQDVPHPTIERVASLVNRTPAAAVPVPALLLKTAKLLRHPAYPAAQAAVRKTATTLGFNRPEAWQGLSRQMKSSPGSAENTYRHMQACQWTKLGASSTLTNPDCNLLVELAYHEFAERGD